MPHVTDRNCETQNNNRTKRGNNGIVRFRKRGDTIAERKVFTISFNNKKPE